MRTHIALLRGINVGGRNRVAMKDLRGVVTSLGHADVATYIQSGNVVFSSVGEDTGALATALERALAEKLGVEPVVVVRSRGQWLQMVAENPYPDQPDPKRLHAVLTPAALGPDVPAALAAATERARANGSRDDARQVGNTVFLHTPDGFGRSELAAQLARKGGLLAPDARSTARNWATVERLRALCEGA